jgi:hypothetical protein
MACFVGRFWKLEGAVFNRLAGKPSAGTRDAMTWRSTSVFWVGKSCNLMQARALSADCYSPHSHMRPVAVDRTQTRSQASSPIGV